MKLATFACPYCSSPLRIRDRALVDREVGCPDCGELIAVTLNRDHEPVARKVTETPPKENRKSPPRQKTKRRAKREKSADSQPAPNQKMSAPQISRKPLIALGERFAGVPEVLFSPVGIAWLVAGVVAVSLLIVVWPGDSSQADHQTVQASDGESSAAEDPPIDAEEDIPSPEPPIPEDAGGATVESRLEELGGSLEAYVKRRGYFPVGTVGVGKQPVEDRFSWLAELVVQNAQRRQAEPQWDQPWHDPLNDRFVRQQLAPFLNPNIPRRAGSDRYPTTHFVGVAGVGSDAPSLPVDHPRAGVFGIDRITRPEHIRDGAANTMMVAGINDRLGSWAAGGRPTLRAFTREPYIEGPDGFGTGEAGGMSVLMADGSVRFLAAETSPVIIRRLGAMADGLPLDEAVPGEPGDPPTAEDPDPPKPKQEIPPAIAERPEKPPADGTDAEEPAPMPPEEPVNIPKALAVKIVKFEQVQGAPFEELLYQVEEMCGVPIRRGDDLPDEKAELWEQRVSLRLKDTTVQQILAALLEKVNLSYTIETDHIRLHQPK